LAQVSVTGVLVEKESQFSQANIYIYIMMGDKPTKVDSVTAQENDVTRSTMDKTMSEKRPIDATEDPSAKRVATQSKADEFSASAESIKAAKLATCRGFPGTEIVKCPSEATSLSSCIALSNGVAMPVVGFGTYKLKDKEVTDPVNKALDSGYVLIDSAQVYEHEKDLGLVLKEKSRTSYFFETKLWRSSHTYDRAQKTTKTTLKKHKVDYVDLYLIHWPGCKSGWPLKSGTTCPPNWTPSMRNDTWRAMEDFYLDGKARAIGVSNYSIRHLKDLIAICRIKPMVLQVEFHPKLIQSELLEFCKEHGIVVQAYASLGGGDSKNGGGTFFSLPGIPQAAKAHGKTPGQVLLRWGLEKGLCIIPKSCKEERIKENSDIFDFKLTPEEIAAIDKNNANARQTWKGVDPDSVE